MASVNNENGQSKVILTCGDTEEDEEEDTRPFRRDVAVGREVLDLVGRQVGHRRHVVGDGRDDAQSSRNARIR